MSIYTLVSPSIDGRVPRTVLTAKRGLGILATLSMVAGPVAAQATDAIAAPMDFGRLALAVGVVSAIVLIKVWANADKRSKLMDRLTSYLTSRAAHRARQATANADKHVGIAKSNGGATGQSQAVPTGKTATAATSHAAVFSDAQPSNGVHVLPVPGLPARMQYLSD